MIYYNEWTDTGPTHDTGTCVGVAVANDIQLFLILQLDRFGTSFQRLEVYGNAQQCTRLSECFPVFTNMIQQSRSAQLVHLIPTIGYRYYTISESLVQNNKPKRSFKSFLRFTAAKIIPGPSNILLDQFDRAVVPRIKSCLLRRGSVYNSYQLSRIDPINWLSRHVVNNDGTLHSNC